MRTVLAPLTLSLLVACGSSSGRAPTPEQPAGPALLIRQDAELAGANCPAGGTAIRAGLDADADGVLSDAEVAKTTFACGAVPAPVLARTIAEPSGPNCADGGTRVDSGRDASGDGTLEDTEVERTSYVCSAPADPPAPPAPPVLTIVAAETPGANCPLGGSAVQSGPDVNGDGTLAGTEATYVDYLCDTAALHGFVVASEEDASTLRLASVVKGEVVVESPTLVHVEIFADRVLGSIIVRNNPKLTGITISRSGFLALPVTVSGSLVVTDNPALYTISLPHEVSAGVAPSRVTGDLVIARNAALASTMYLAGLAHVDGSIDVSDNPSLRSLTLEGLQRVGGDLRMAGNALLGAGDKSWIAAESIGGTLILEGPGGAGMVQLPNLASAGAIAVRRLDTRDTLLAAFALRVVTGSVAFEQNFVYAGIAAPSLLAIGGDFAVTENALMTWAGQLTGLATIGGDVSVRSNPKLIGIGLPSLRTAASLTIDDNAMIADLQGGAEGLGHLDALGTLSVSRSPALAHLRLPALSMLRGLSVATSPLVPTCEVQALLAQLSASPPTASVSGTDDAAICTP